MCLLTINRPRSDAVVTAGHGLSVVDEGGPAHAADRRGRCRPRSYTRRTVDEVGLRHTGSHGDGRSCGRSWLIWSTGSITDPAGSADEYSAQDGAVHGAVGHRPGAAHHPRGRRRRIDAADQPGARRVPSHHVCPALPGAARHRDRPRAPGEPGRSRRWRTAHVPAARRRAEDAPARPADPEARRPARRAQRDGRSAGAAAPAAGGPACRRDSRRRMGFLRRRHRCRVPAPEFTVGKEGPQRRAGVTGRARGLGGDPLRDSPARLRRRRAARTVGERPSCQTPAAWLGPHPGPGPGRTHAPGQPGGGPVACSVPGHRPAAAVRGGGSRRSSPGQRARTITRGDDPFPHPGGLHPPGPPWRPPRAGR